MKPNKKASALTSVLTSDVTLPGGSPSALLTNEKLLEKLVSCRLLGEKTAYMDAMFIDTKIQELIPKCSPEFVANLVLKCRVEQKLRHTPIFMIVEMLQYEPHKKYVADLIPKVFTRLDMVTDFVAMYWAKNGRITIPHQAKKGIKVVLNNATEYQMGKYKMGGKEVKLPDVIKLVRPKAKSEAQSELFRKAVKGELATPDTWEVEISKNGNNAESWTRLIQENKLGGLAMFRNIANMRKVVVPKSVIEKGINTANTSMLLPLDFLKAATQNAEFERQIEDVMLKTFKDLPKLKGKTLLVVDVSGSMGSPLSLKSDFTRLDAAIALAMLAVNRCEEVVLVATAGIDIESEGKHVVIPYPMKGFGIAQQIKDTRNIIGRGGIFTRQCLEWCAKTVGTDYDRIIVISDSADCDRDNPVAKPFGKYNYIIDISSEALSVDYTFKSGKTVWTFAISGWSETFLDYIHRHEN